MTIFTNTLNTVVPLGVAAGNGELPYNAFQKVGIVSVTLDWADITASRTAESQTAIGAGDGLAALVIPAKTRVLGVGLDVTTAEGGTLTIDVGDGSDADGWLDGVDGNAVASYYSTPVLTEGAPNTIVPAYGLGKYYSAEDNIDLITVNAADAAVMTLWAIVARY